MKIENTLRVIAFLVIAAFTSYTSLQAQTYTLQQSASQMEVLGTSNIHDWELTVEDIKGTLEVTKKDNVLKSIENLQLSILTESLKSGKGGMDKNTFKALNTSDYKNITYTLKGVESINPKSGKDYTISTTGDLMIAGVTKSVSIVFDVQILAGQITLKGEQEITMTDYKIDPPKALFGTITTGEKVIIKFKTTFIK
jgi:polyisoprenoid-binding protein YceI